MNPCVLRATLPRGFSFSASSCGLKKNALDLGLLVSEVPAAAACVFTTNLAPAAPVIISREHLRRAHFQIRAVIVNSGNANCATGPSGLLASRRTAAAIARALGCRAEEVLVCSTGIIGVPFRVERILRAVPQLAGRLAISEQAFARFTRSIMTTDTRRKWVQGRCRIGGRLVRILGCAKGAGMIHPRMATMLAFLATDAAVSPAAISRALRESIAGTFNTISIDGDTSTNDTVALLANGASGARSIRTGSPEYRKFQLALESACRSLALQIVSDGEGARRVIEIEVRGAPSNRAADQVARTIANSPLVKTALAGADPNWGRILAAAGRAGVRFNPSRVSIRMAGILVCHNGQAYPFRDRLVHRRLLGKFIPIVVDLGMPRSGRSKERENCCARLWTCDLTAEYVRINASYRS